MVKEIYDENGEWYSASKENVGLKITCPECGDTVVCMENYVCGFQDEYKDKCWKICKLRNCQESFNVSAKEYFDEDLDYERQKCNVLGKCNPMIYRKPYYYFGHLHSKEKYGDCSFRYSSINKLMYLKRLIAIHDNAFDKFGDFLKSDERIYGDIVFCSTQKSFKDLYPIYRNRKYYIFDLDSFRKWRQGNFYSWFNKHTKGYYLNILFVRKNGKTGNIILKKINKYDSKNNNFIFMSSQSTNINCDECYYEEIY